MTGRSTNSQFKSRRFVRFLTAVLVLAIFPLQALAISVTEYHLNLQRAITALDTLAQIDENETSANFDLRVRDTSGAVRQAIPETQSIETGESTITVDNSWLHKRLDELELAGPTDSANIRNELIHRLKALDDRVVELQNASAGGLTKSEANARLANILTRDEYTASKNQKGSAISRLLDRFVRWLQGILPERSPTAPTRGSVFTRVAQIFVIVLALLVIAYAVFKLFKHFRGRVRSTKTKKKREARIVLGEKLEPDASATDLLAEAESLARTGDVRAAIRKAYIALLVELGDRKLISLAQYKTNRDYLRSVRNLPSLHNNMTGLTDSFERHWYGFAQTSTTDWQNFKAAYLTALRASD